MSSTIPAHLTIAEIAALLRQPDHRVRRSIERLRLKPASIYARRFKAFDQSVVDRVKADLHRIDDRHRGKVAR